MSTHTDIPYPSSNRGPTGAQLYTTEAQPGPTWNAAWVINVTILLSAIHGNVNYANSLVRLSLPVLYSYLGILAPLGSRSGPGLKDRQR